MNSEDRERVKELLNDILDSDSMNEVHDLIVNNSELLEDLIDTL